MGLHNVLVYVMCSTQPDHDGATSKPGLRSSSLRCLLCGQGQRLVRATVFPSHLTWNGASFARPALNPTHSDGFLASLAPNPFPLKTRNHIALHECFGWNEQKACIKGELQDTPDGLLPFQITHYD